MPESAYILLVDDDSALLQALPQALRLRIPGITIDTASSALEALEYVGQHDYDAIVSDIKMPGMDGLELLGHIKTVRPDTPIILITGHGEHDLAIRALRGGTFDYIQKPIDRDAFVAALQRAIQNHQLRRQVLEQHIALGQHAKALEIQVQRRTSELQEANDTKEKFLGIVSHELKQPVANVQGMTQHLRRQLDQGESTVLVSQGLTELERSLQRMSVLIQDLLDTSSIDRNMFVLHCQRQNIVPLCQQLLHEYTGGAGPKLISEMVDDEPVEVEVDASRFGQALMNLLANARKYSVQGSSITVTIQQVGYEATISVQDQGNGISDEALPHLFEQFYRAPDAEVQNGSRPGLGLGLYITRKIIERHGGRVEVRSLAEQGSLFTLVLPLSFDASSKELTSIDSVAHTRASWMLSH